MPNTILRLPLWTWSDPLSRSHNQETLLKSWETKSTCSSSRNRVIDDFQSNAEMLGTSSYCLGPVPSTVPSILSFAPWRSQHPSASIARYKAHLPRVGWCWAPSVGVMRHGFPTCTTKATVLTSTNSTTSQRSTRKARICNAEGEPLMWRQKRQKASMNIQQHVSVYQDVSSPRVFHL